MRKTVVKKLREFAAYDSINIKPTPQNKFDTIKKRLNFLKKKYLRFNDL